MSIQTNIPQTIIPMQTDCRVCERLPTEGNAEAAEILFNRIRPTTTPAQFDQLCASLPEYNLEDGHEFVPFRYGFSRRVNVLHAAVFRGNLTLAKHVIKKS